MPFFHLTLFAIAFGWLEAVVVVYIRKIMLAESIIDISRVVISSADSTLLRIEQAREVSTIIILVCLALIFAKTWRKRVASFLLAFGLWDIFYYISLKVLIDWPPSLRSLDCLFLIPCPWIVPVYVPILASILMIFSAVYLFLK